MIYGVARDWLLAAIQILDRYDNFLNLETESKYYCTCVACYECIHIKLSYWPCSICLWTPLKVFLFRQPIRLYSCSFIVIIFDVSLVLVIYCLRNYIFILYCSCCTIGIIRIILWKETCYVYLNYCPKTASNLHSHFIEYILNYLFTWDVSTYILFRINF